MKKKIIIACLIIISFSYVCYKFYGYINKTNKNNNPQTANIQTASKNEVNYLFFINGKKKDITFYFNTNIGELTKNIKSVKLLQDENIMASANDVEIFASQTIDNKIAVTLNKYISQFNRAEITLYNDKQINLNVGQFYLEKIDNYPDTSRITLEKSHSVIEKNSFALDFSIKQNTHSKIIFKYPKMLDSLKVIDKLTEVNKTQNEISYAYHLEIPKQEDKSITTELICIEEFENVQYSIFKLYVPLEK